MAKRKARGDVIITGVQERPPLSPDEMAELAYDAVMLDLTPRLNLADGTTVVGSHATSGPQFDSIKSSHLALNRSVNGAVVIDADYARGVSMGVL